MKKSSTFILAVAMLSLISACSNNPQGKADDAAPSGPPVASAAPTADPLAIAKIEEFSSPNPSAEQARQMVLQECMAQKGHNWTLQPVQQLKIDDLLIGVPLTIEDARVYGYDVPSSRPTEPPAPGDVQGAQEAFMGTFDGETTTTDLFGSTVSVSNDGCLATSLSEVYGSIERGMQAIGAVDNALLPAMNGVSFDKSVTDLLPVWATCMEENSFPNIPTPDRAWQQAQENPSIANNVAVADAKCREQVGYESTRRDAASRYLTNFLTANEALITEIQAIRSDGAKRGQEILAGQ